VRSAISDFEKYKTYHPAKVVLLPISEVQKAEKANQSDTIVAYVQLQDAADVAMKGPGVFRFELYRYQPMAADPKGKRMHIWDDINLMDFMDNSEQWRDYLRAYEFKLDYYCPDCERYVLEVTCTSPWGQRMIDVLIIDK
jgi:hypothetical protein